MNKDDLLKMLDLSGLEHTEPGSTISTISTADPEKATLSASPTALAMDEWGLRRGRDLLAESERLRTACRDEHAAADFHAVAFDPDPQLLPGCVEPRRREFLAQLLDTPEYRSLHASTRLDDVAAGIACVHFAEQFSQLKNDDAEAGTDADPMAREMAALRAVGRAVAEARTEVAECKDAAAALGLGPGAPGSNDPRAIAALFKRVRSDLSLRRICELAGRFRRVAQSKQRRKAAHGLDDVVGVEPGGDVGRLLPHELAKLAIPELEMDALRRLSERQMLCREYHAVEPVGKGPIVVCVDESGSMENDKVHAAKALALALAWIARRQRRWCALIAYSGDSGERLLPLPPGRWDEAALADWLSEFIGCGSTLDVPVRELPDYFRRLKAPTGDTDVIFITDAQAHIPREDQNRFQEWKRTTQARLITLVIGTAAGDLAAISDEVHLLPAIEVSEEAIGRVLSI